MITQFPNRNIVVACVVFVLASLGLTMFVWRSVGGPVPFGAKSYEVQALFDNAGQLVQNADVRIAGVNVGKVTKIRPRGLRTEATLSIDAQYAPLASDVRAILRAKTLLGETFVSLTPGTGSGPKLDDGGRIPGDQIEDTQPLDRVLGTLDEDGRKRLHELFVDTGSMLDGRAQDLNDAAGNFATGTRQLDELLRILDGQSADVATLTRETGRVMQTVGDEQLTAAVRATPPFLRELGATSAAAARTATTAAPVLREFRPVAPRIAPTLRTITEASPEVEGLLRDFGSLTPLAREALPATALIVSALSPFMTETEPNAKQIVPVIQYVAAYRRELVAAMANIGAMAQGKAPASDGRQTAYLRTIVPFGAQSLVGSRGRRPDNRHAAYMAPGGLDHIKDGLRSSSCANAGDGAVPAPACRVEPGWSFAGGKTAYFQRLTDEPVVPGTVSQLRSLATFG